ncbi:BTAD domain-containing putative transcriptional regulator [Actinoplanes auranticolor]|uniref:BTAD domain-containing putative transcriptional regulator n=1 Tax=Actinoplanes auranticolor TaxID=47988 RepID=UPI002484C43F|nr:BTAD domain-containing putative transcriptional regulator [Actinoplanes auranticolor]
MPAITTLGVLAVDGKPVRGERLAALLRELIGARGRVVSTVALVEAVWQGDPPDDVAGALQALVSRVRRLGVPVDAVAGGYRVPAERVDVDAVAVRMLIDKARAATDPTVARAAADEARARFPEVPELASAADLRLFAELAALRAEAALAGAGAFDEADLRRLVGHTPPDEPAAALLIRVLAAQGRDAEALEVFERLRAELADRYGADPSPVLAEAHLALLRGELTAAPHRPAGTLPRGWRRPATALVGREDDVLTVTTALAEAPLVTIVATGGAGKTRLAAEIARRSAGPVRVIELAGLRAPEEVLAAVLAVLGGAETAATGPRLTLERRVLSPEERWRAVATDLDGLLVFDNCEHLLDAAAAVVADLLAAAGPELAVLATSRAPLALAGEVVHRLPVLPDPEALRLLQTRARAGGAVPTWDEDRALALCHRLDNLPLALELAAARLRHMPIDDVLAGLSDRFALLDDALRGLPERHASLWAMVDWSRELLRPDARELLQRLAVIPAAFTAELAAAVAGRPDVRRGLADLVEQSLVLLDGEGGTPHYRMLETVREYGEARLGADRQEAAAGLTGWARAHAVRLNAHYLGPGQLDAFAECAAEQENLLAGLRFAMTRPDQAAAVDIAAALVHLWTVRGLHVEVSAWGRELLQADDPVGRRHSPLLHGRSAGPPLPDADRLAWLCLLIGVNGGITGPPRLIVLARRALRLLLAERPAEVSARQRALAAALPAFDSFDPEESLAGAVALIDHPDPYVQAIGYFGRAAMRENGGMFSGSVEDAELAYRRFELAGDHWGMALAAQAAGHWVSSRDDARAAVWLARSVRHMELLGATQDARSIRVLLDVQQALAGDPDAEHRLRALATSRQADDNDAAQAYLGLAHLAWQRQRYDEALAYGDAVTRTVAASADPAPQPRVICRVAVAVLHLRVAEAQPAPEADAYAVTLLRLARDEALTNNDNPLLGTWALGGAELAAGRGADETARELWVLGMRIGANIGNLSPPGEGGRLRAVLGGEDERQKMLAAMPARQATTISSRIRELMDTLLA